MHDHTDEPALLRAGAVAARGRSDDAGLSPTARAVLHLQRTAGNAGVAGLLAGEEERSPVLDVVGRGGGRALDPATRGGMEQRFGTDFSDVRVHTDGAAAASATSVQAHAYTVGNEIVFGAGRYSPESADGERTLAHELTHVVQQRAGEVDGAATGGGIRVSDPSDRFEREAEATADAVTGGGRADVATAAPSPAAVQREEVPEEEDESLQALAVQRDEAPVEEEEEEPLQAMAVQRHASGEEHEEPDPAGLG